MSIHSANLRVLNDLSGAVIEERRRSGRINCDREIGRVQIAETIEVDLIRRAGRAAGVSGRCSCATCGGSGGGCIDVVLQRYCGTGGRVNAQCPRFVAAHLHDSNIYDHFGAGFIQIANEFLCQRNLVRRAAHHQRSLGWQRLNTGYFQDLPKCVYNIL